MKFSRRIVTNLLKGRYSRIMREQRFLDSTGTSQLTEKRDAATQALVRRAVEYGRAQAMKEILESIDNLELSEDDIARGSLL